MTGLPRPRALRATTLALSLVLTACGSESPPASTAPQATGAGLATEAVTRAQVLRETLLDGRVEAQDQATVAAQTAATVVELPVDVGDVVTQGQVIARLRAVNAQAGLGAAQASVEEARARRAEVALRYARTREVWDKKLIARAQYDQAEAEMKAADARLAAAEAAAAQAQEGLSYTVVRAPYDGIVLRRDVAVGAVAMPGQALMTGVSLDHLRVRVAVPQQQIAALRKHPQAQIQLDDGNRLNVTQLRIPPAADAQTQSFDVVLELPADAAHAAALFPGTLVRVALPAGDTEQLQIPRSALVLRGELAMAYVVDEQQRASLRYLRVGRADSQGRVPVLAGLAEGERVALDPVAAGQQVPPSEGARP